VKDKGQTRTAGLFGGTVLTTGILTTDALKQYTQSIAHYLDTAKRMNVDVELQNSSDLRRHARQARKAEKRKGDRIQLRSSLETIDTSRMWNIVSECIQAEIARREGSN
jgi:hypothetical protein